ncbi:DUF6879 family protein [Nocardiopsis flavescens]|uniref:DUF6879 family protein n=1 Tax=Nocardiopsis flavescens TaxID=758803 RepID=UPI00364DA23C
MRLASLDDPRIEALVSSSQVVFRLETRQHYQRPEELDALASHRAGLLPPAEPQEAVAERLRLLQHSADRGATVQRVHVVQEPTSFYLEFRCLWEIPYSVAAGEDVRILAVPRRRWPRGIPRQDLWLCDTTLVHLDHAADGRLLGVDVLTSPALVANAQRVRDTAWAAAAPFADYLTT